MIFGSIPGDEIPVAGWRRSRLGVTRRCGFGGVPISGKNRREDVWLESGWKAVVPSPFEFFLTKREREISTFPFPRIFNGVTQRSMDYWKISQRWSKSGFAIVQIVQLPHKFGGNYTIRLLRAI